MANEKRLIDANALEELGELPYVYNPVANGTPWYRANDVWGCIEREPTVDAVEVVHGRWEKAEYYGWIRCDKCKDVYLEEGYLGNGKWNYCPNCGAKMDGGNEVE